MKGQSLGNEENFTKSEREKIDTLRLSPQNFIPKELFTNERLNIKFVEYYLNQNPKHDINSLLTFLVELKPNICSKELISFLEEFITKHFTKDSQEQTKLTKIKSLNIYPQNTIQQPQTSEKTSKQSCFLDL
jgi:hypothetical protein